MVEELYSAEEQEALKNTKSSEMGHSKQQMNILYRGLCIVKLHQSCTLLEK